jgi:hypothetical protein
MSRQTLLVLLVGSIFAYMQRPVNAIELNVAPKQSKLESSPPQYILASPSEIIKIRENNIALARDIIDLQDKLKAILRSLDKIGSLKLTEIDRICRARESVLIDIDNLRKGLVTESTTAFKTVARATDVLKAIDEKIRTGNVSCIPND